MNIQEPLTSEQISFTLNEDPLKEAATIKAERTLLRERIEKLENTRNAVSDSVYQKVRTDYLTKLNQTTDRLVALKRELEKEEKGLLEKKQSIAKRFTLHKENREEAQLRHTLGELTEKQHNEILKNENEEINRLEEAFKKIESALERHTNIFEGENLEISRPQKTRAEDHTVKVNVEPSHNEAPPPSHSQKTVPELQVYENGKVIQKVTLDKKIAIGRSPSSEVILKETKVSRKHAEIQPAAGKYILLDLESSNGTYVGGEKITEHTLQSGDEIVIGNTKMVFTV